MIYFDLKEEAKNKSIGNVVGRDVELRRIARTVRRQYNNNILLVGASGIGKSALLEGFAYQVATGKISGFEDTNLIKLDAGNLKKIFDGTANSEVASFLSNAFKSLPAETIVFIDDFENALADGRLLEVQKFFEPFFERNDLRLFLTISEARYQKLLEENARFFQNFEEIKLKENDLKETAAILAALSPAFEKEYGIKIDAAQIKNVAERAQKIPSDKKFPLRAIHLLDESLAFAKISGDKKLSSAHIQEIFSEKTGVPSTALNHNDATQLQNLESELNRHVIGQSKAVTIVSDVIRRGRMGLRNPNRPIGSFLFLGPSGVGKTELAKVLARIVYGTERAFTRIDMSEFAEQHTVQRLIGAPPGYVGYESGGQLTNAIKQQPYSLILLDEIEKANARVFDIFLQVFDDGRLTDGRGETINFSNSIVVATSNLGINEIVDAYQNAHLDENFQQEILMPILMQNFRTEFLNRFDAIIIFNPLSVDDLLSVAMLEIQKIEERTKEHGIKFNIEPQTLRGKISTLIDHKFGARPVKRFVEQVCESLIAAKLLNEGAPRMVPSDGTLASDPRRNIKGAKSI